MSFTAQIELSSLDGTNGFIIHGIDSSGSLGFSVSSAGDVNGDGFDDFIVGAPSSVTLGNPRAGQSYVVFGKDGGFAPLLDLSDLNGNNGFVVNGVDQFDSSGFSVSSAGDVNSDGFDDVIIGALLANPSGRYSEGGSYVIFGQSEGFTASVNLTNLNGSNGFVLIGVDQEDRSGSSVSNAGDVNGDGFDDIIIGAKYADPNGQYWVGESYVVFGQGEGFAASLSLRDLNGSNGFTLKGIDPLDFSGISVSGAGDINGDGFDDIIIGAPGADPNGQESAGESYVVFGQSAGFNASLNLQDLNGSNGFTINGIANTNYSGQSVSSAGDVNGDGFDDIIVGAPAVSPNGKRFVGESYVVFGHDGNFASSLNLSALNGSNGFTLKGIDSLDHTGVSVSGVGDVNGDGFDDIIVGAWYADPNGKSNAGKSYVVFGKSKGFAPSINLSDLSGVNGFTINGIDPNDASGFSVSGAGDINADGFDDLIIGAWRASQNGDFVAGESYVIFGQISLPPGSPIIGSLTSNFLVGTTEGEIIKGLAGNDTLRGMEGQDTIFGNRGDDLLIGNQSRDRLIGGYGLDTLIGGAAADKFVFQGTQFGADRIVDFNVNNDLILVKQSGFDVNLTIGTLSNAQFAVGNTAIASNTRFIYDEQTGTLSFDADGNGSQAAEAIAFLSPNLALTAQNIRVF